MEETITASPSYPPEAATARGVYRHLALLRLWVEVEQSALRPLLTPEFAANLMPPEEPESEAIWSTVSLADQHSVFRYMQQIRESWDATLRLHEDAWTARAAIAKRYELLLVAMNVLSSAFVPAEVSEMRSQQAQAEHAKYHRKLERKLKELVSQSPDQESDDASVVDETTEG